METKEVTLKYTDGLFKFPVKTYDGRSLREFMRKEEKQELAEDETDPDWCVGWIKIPANEIVGLREFFTQGRTMQDVAENGHDLTIVLTRTLGDYVSTWKIEKIEDKLNEFVDSYEKKVDAYSDQKMREKGQQGQNQISFLIPKEVLQKEPRKRRGFGYFFRSRK